MADNFFDVRTKVGPREHAVLSALAQAAGHDIAELVRDLIVRHVDSEVHKAKVVTSVLRGEGDIGSGRA